MAKGCKLTIRESERFFGSYNNNVHVDDDVELGEDDMWSMVDDMIIEKTEINKINHPINGSWNTRAVTGGRRRVGLSAAFDDQQGKRIVHQFRHGGDVASPRGRQVATSAPVNVPDWSKIYRVVSVESMHNDDSDYESSSDQMVPPHEYLARSHRSVFEGVGRTLKGRDLSRVRDAVWSQTGFDG
ncbi:senescence regulator [Tanacetum coccineum]